MSEVLGIDINQLIQPLMLKSVLKGEEVPIDTIVDLMISEKIEEQLLASVTIPSEFADIVNLMLEMDKLKRLMAILRGETPPEPAIDKVIELIINLQLVESLGTITTTA